MANFVIYLFISSLKAGKNNLQVVWDAGIYLYL